MRFLVAESTGPAVAHWLRQQGHDVSSVYAEARGAEDDEIMRKAFQEDRVLVTNDKDFGEKVYRARRQHRGVVVLRLRDERAASKIGAVRRLLQSYADRLPGHFVTVTETRVRFAQTPKSGLDQNGPT